MSSNRRPLIAAVCAASVAASGMGLAQEAAPPDVTTVEGVTSVGTAFTPEQVEVLVDNAQSAQAVSLARLAACRQDTLDLGASRNPIGQTLSPSLALKQWQEMRFETARNSKAAQADAAAQQKLIEAGRAAQDAAALEASAQTAFAAGRITREDLDAAVLARQSADTGLSRTAIYVLEERARIMDRYALEAERMRGRVFADPDYWPDEAIEAEVARRAEVRAQSGVIADLSVLTEHPGAVLAEVKSEQRTVNGRPSVYITGYLANFGSQPATIPGLVVKALDARQRMVRTRMISSGRRQLIPAESAIAFAYTFTPVPSSVIQVTVQIDTYNDERPRPAFCSPPSFGIAVDGGRATAPEPLPPVIPPPDEGP